MVRTVFLYRRAQDLVATWDRKTMKEHLDRKLILPNNAPTFPDGGSDRLLSPEPGLLRGTR